MADTPANLYPDITTDFLKFYASQVDGVGFGQIPAELIAHADGASDGDIFYVDGGEVVRLAAPDDNEVLTGSGGLPVWTEGFAFKKIAQSVVSSPVSSVIFSGIPSTGYSKYILTVNEARSSDTGGNIDFLLLQVSTDNGSTWKTTSGDYQTQSGTNRSSIIGPAIPATAGTVTAARQNAVIEITGLGVATRLTATTFTSVRDYNNLNATMTILLDTNACLRTLAEADNAFRVITLSAGNITAGTFTLYGVVE